MVKLHPGGFTTNGATPSSLDQCNVHVSVHIDKSRNMIYKITNIKTNEKWIYKHTSEHDYTLLKFQYIYKYKRLT